MSEAKVKEQGNVPAVSTASIIKDAITLMLITLVSAALLGFVNEITKEPIARMQAQTKKDAYMAVFSTAASIDSENEAVNAALLNQRSVLDSAGLTTCSIDEAAAALDSDGNVIGYCLLVTNSKGYGGDITFAMGISKDGTIQGISFTTLSESPGLGMEAEKSKFKDQFVGIKADEVTYSKTGASAENEIDAISGATITTRAVTNGVNAGIAFAKTIG
jgi:Na+-translocating ferredoxin:NAD+ oxidoreductase subunit G